MGGEELPVLPMSVNGSVVMTHGPDDGTSSASQFFFYQFDKRSAGLGKAVQVDIRLTLG